MSHKECSNNLEARFKPEGAAWRTIALDRYLAKLFVAMDFELPKFVDEVEAEQSYAEHGDDTEVG